jgi:hypothetical protein
MMSGNKRAPYRVLIEAIDSPQAATATAKMHVKECRECGQSFLGRGDGWCAPHFCSPECQRQARDRRRKGQRDERRDQRLCELDVRCLVCGEAIEAQRRTRKYCSDKCRLKAGRAGAAGQAL